MRKYDERPPRVYWINNKWQYKSREDERRLIGGVYFVLGKPRRREFDSYFWGRYAELKNVLGSRGGMNDLFDMYITHMQKELEAGNLSARTVKDYKRDIEVYLRPVFGKMEPSQVKTSHVQDYSDIRGRQAPRRANIETGILSRVFKKAIQRDIVKFNPCAGIDRNKETPRDRVPEIWELEAFKNGATEFLKVYVDLKYMTALRVGHLLELKLREIDFNGLGISGKTQKGKVKFSVPWDEAGELKAVIHEMMALNKVQGQTLICSSDGTPLPYKNFNQRWNRRMKYCLKHGIIKDKFHEHDIRARHVDDAEKLGLDGSQQLTHTQKATTERYRNRKQEYEVTPLRRLK